MIEKLFALILAAAPRGSSYAPHEGATAREARYLTIAVDASIVASERPLPGLTPDQTARVLLAIAEHESGFSADVDSGQCVDTHKGRCDGGRAVCIMQILARDSAERAELRDRRACFRRGRDMLVASQRTCRSEPFAVYAGGSCERPSAIATGRELQAYARKWLAAK